MIGIAVPCGARAANAAHPYSNIDRRVDAGNDTGDSQVDRLNQAQLRQALRPRRQIARGFAAPGHTPYGAPGYAPAYRPGAGYGWGAPLGYYPPPPAYYRPY